MFCVALITATFLVIGHAKPTTEETKVLILGAGAAGLSAAKTLSEHGINDFLIIEGSDRIGGRVKSVHFAGKTVEAGANWIVGEGDNPLKILQENLSFSGKKSDFDSVTIRNFNGSDVTDTEGEPAWEKLDNAQGRLKRIAQRLRDKENKDMSLRTGLDIGGWRAKSAVEKSVEIYDYDFEFGNIADVTSLIAADDIMDELSNQFLIQDPRGYEFLLKKHVENHVAANDSRIRYNQIVKDIQYTNDNVKVITDAGKVFKADYAIVTFSIGVLKSGKVQFSPALPGWKVDALFRIRMETYMGLYFKFPDSMQRFWDDTEFVLYSDERRGYYPVFQNMEAAGLFPAGTNILEIKTFGEEADRVSGLTNAEIKGEVMEILRRIYKDPTIPDPVDFYYQNWKNDPLFAGSFANNEPGTVEPGNLEKILKPVGRLYFAGDAVEGKWEGYVYGALRSGEKAAREIADDIQ